MDALTYVCIHAVIPLQVGAITVTNHLALLATSDLVAGEEVTISYLGHLAGKPVHARRQILQQGYGFLCQCPRCLVESP